MATTRDGIEFQDYVNSELQRRKSMKLLPWSKVRTTFITAFTFVVLRQSTSLSRTQRWTVLNDTAKQIIGAQLDTVQGA
jgi:hypothetical protein